MPSSFPDTFLGVGGREQADSPLSCCSVGGEDDSIQVSTHNRVCTVKWKIKWVGGAILNSIIKEGLLDTGTDFSTMLRLLRKKTDGFSTLGPPGSS